MQFRPSLASTLAITPLCLLFGWLSVWQWHQSVAKQALVDDFSSATELAELPVPGAAPRFSRVQLQGFYLENQDFLIDNRIHKGRAGVQVLTPFQVAGSPFALLVNRGWLSLPDRTQLPIVPTTQAGESTIRGYLDNIKSPGATLGDPDKPQADSWPQLLTYPDIDTMESALGLDLYPQVLYLDADNADGFAGRDWQPIFMTPARHRGYSVQWAGLAVTGMVAWVILGWYRGKERNT